MSVSLVVSSYPLTQGYRASITTLVGRDAAFATVADLRRNSVTVLLRRAWLGRSRPIFIAIESESSRCLQPALCAMAVFLRGSPVSVISPDGSVSRVTLPQVASGCVRVGLASADAILARFQARYQSSRSMPIAATHKATAEHGWQGTNVLYIKNTLSTGVRAGGSVGHVAGVVNGLVDAGAQVKMITTEPSPMIREGVPEVHPSGMGVLGLPSQANMFRMQRQTVRCAVELTRQWKPDIIYQRLTLGDASGAILSKILNVPLVTEYNGSEVWCNKNWGSGVRYATDFLAAEENMLRASSLVFTISRVLADELAARGVPPDRIGWYPNCIDPHIYTSSRFSDEAICSARAKLGFSRSDFVVTFVGTFGDWHGADVFAKAIAIGSKIGGLFEGLPLRFLFIGDGKNREMAEAIVAASPAATQCRFVGLVPQAETPLLLAASSCFVSPHVPNPDGTAFFGSPTKLFEYMAMERPIIASRLEQIGDILNDGVTAILVDPNNEHALASAIARVARDCDLGLRLANCARAEAIDRFTWVRHVEHIRSRLIDSTTQMMDCS